MMPFSRIITFIICLLFMSCAHNENGFVEEYFKAFPELYMKRIDLKTLPSHPLNSTARVELLKEPKVTIVSIISFECSPCMELIKSWNNYILENELKGELNFIFYAIGDDREYFIREIKRHTFTTPIYWEEYKNFAITNDLLKYGKETYILNDKHEIILFGDPLADKYLGEIFRKLTGIRL